MGAQQRLHFPSDRHNPGTRWETCKLLGPQEQMHKPEISQSRFLREGGDLREVTLGLSTLNT